jgi:hypothetical protein
MNATSRVGWKCLETLLADLWRGVSSSRRSRYLTCSPGRAERAGGFQKIHDVSRVILILNRCHLIGSTPPVRGPLRAAS